MRTMGHSQQHLFALVEADAPPDQTERAVSRLRHSRRKQTCAHMNDTLDTLLPGQDEPIIGGTQQLPCRRSLGPHVARDKPTASTTRSSRRVH